MPRRLSRRLVGILDAFASRLYGWRWNPLHQSGTLAALMLLVLLATGLYLVLVYRVGAPAESLARIAADPWLGRWIRTLHRLASDLFVVAALFHAFRLWSQDRSWGPRALAWISGTLLLGVGLLCAWTGFVMAWDEFGFRLASEGGRLFDALPIFSEPVSRIFAGDAPVPSAFFFVNLFLHIALPLGMGVLIWLHVSRVARPTMLPPRLLGIAIVAGLAVVAMLFPLGFGPAADPWQLPTSTSINLPSAWWLPITEQLPPVAAWMAPVVLVGLMLLVPALSRRPRVGRFAPSVVDPRLCTGCNQCPQDCPWDAITMVARDDDRPTLVALVDPTRCVSCGICAGSCAPMGVGPPDRTGRAQLARVRELDQHTIAGIVVICCGETPVAQREALVARGAVLHPVSCVGNLHSSVVEMLLRAGADGVLVAGCAPRDCVGREGPKWMEQRLYHDREAELQERVDRRRIGTATLTPGGLPEALTTFDALARTVAALRREQGAAELELEEIECVPVPLEVSE